MFVPNTDRGQYWWLFNIGASPEDEFIDFAFRLALQLQKRGLTIVSLPTREEQIQIAQDKAASRILTILTNWMKANPGCSFDSRISASGKFHTCAH